MINSMGSYGSATSLWNVSRSAGTQTASSTEETRKSPGEELFSKLDGDGSGGLSASELQSFVDRMSNDTRGALLSAQETNGSSATATTATSADDLLTAMDTDGDGSVSGSELDDYMRANRPAGGPPPPPPPDDIAATDRTDPLTEMFSTIDADGSGSISQSELSDFLASLKSDATTSTSSTEDTTTTTSTDDPATRFATLDTDGDGSISQSELETYMRSQAPPPPPPPPGMRGDAGGSRSASAAAATPTSDDTTTSSDASTDLAQQLAAAMARFATQAYGDLRSSSAVAGLLATVA
jgi:Ca2+-binding EF-hand superfamily protein